MDQTAQTSFIPKKPLTEERTRVERPVSLFLLLGIVLFITSIVSAGGVYLWKSSLEKTVADMSANLERVKSTFEPNLISELTVLDKRINAAQDLLHGHIALSPLFQALSTLTLKNIQFTKFSYSVSRSDTLRIAIDMSGKARDYTSIALQAQKFGENAHFKDVIFSNLTLDEQGNVSFDLDFSVDPDFLRFDNAILSTPSTNTNSGASTSNVPAIPDTTNTNTFSIPGITNVGTQGTGGANQ